MLEPTIDELRQKLGPDEPMQLIGTSGTIECLAGIVAHKELGMVPAPLNGFRMSFKELSKLVDQLRKSTYTERLAMPEMSSRRAEIIVAGAVILQEAMDMLGGREHYHLRASPAGRGRSGLDAGSRPD